MKVKFLAVFLTGLLLGALLGNILLGQVIARSYPSPETEIHYLKEILDRVENTEEVVLEIEKNISEFEHIFTIINAILNQLILRQNL